MFYRGMQISSLQNIYKINPIKQQQTQKPKVNFCGDCFVKNQSATDILNEGKNFKIDSYKKLSAIDKKELLKKIDKKTKEDTETNYKIAKEFKAYLDRIHGEDNYIFECIGTSPAPIARFLEFSGTEVHYIPISNLQETHYINDIITGFNDNNNKYKDFLSSQGIYRGMEEDTDKKILFYDYTCSGQSLAMFRNLLGIKYDIIPSSYQMDFRSLNKDLLSICKKENITELTNYLNDFLEGCGSEKYAGVPHLDWKEVEKIDEVKNEKSSEKERLFNFYTMYLLEQDGLLKENSANKNSL